MDLTEQHLEPLNNEYVVYYASSASSELPPAKKLQECKESVCAWMRSFRYLGPEARRIVQDDELRVCGDYEVEFRDKERQIRDIDNLAYWEAKDRFYEREFNRIEKIPQRDTPQERNRKAIEAWLPAVESPELVVVAVAEAVEPAPRSMSVCSISVRSSSGISSRGSSSLRSVALLSTRVDHLPIITSSRPKQIAIPAKPPKRPGKRKRPPQDHSDENPRAPKIATRRLPRVAKAAVAGRPIDITKAQSRAAARTVNDGVLPRRSARIAAMPRKKYGP